MFSDDENIGCRMITEILWLILVWSANGSMRDVASKEAISCSCRVQKNVCACSLDRVNIKFKKKIVFAVFVNCFELPVVVYCTYIVVVLSIIIFMSSKHLIA